MSTIQVVIESIDDDFIEYINKVITNDVTALDLYVVNPSEEIAIYHKLITIINNSNITDLSYRMDIDDGYNAIHYYNTLHRIISANKLKKLSFTNCDVNQVDSRLTFNAINNSGIRIISTKYYIFEKEYKVLKHNTRLIKFECDDPLEFGDHANVNFNDKVLDLVNVNITRINSVQTRCIIILNSPYLYRDLRKLLAKYVWYFRF